jgi:hypothetical protein
VVILLALKYIPHTPLEYVQKFATKEAADAATGGKKPDEDDEDEEMSAPDSDSDE